MGGAVASATLSTTLVQPTTYIYAISRPNAERGSESRLPRRRNLGPPPPGHPRYAQGPAVFVHLSPQAARDGLATTPCAPLIRGTGLGLDLAVEARAWIWVEMGHGPRPR